MFPTYDMNPIARRDAEIRRESEAQKLLKRPRRAIFPTLTTLTPLVTVVAVAVFY